MSRGRGGNSDGDEELQDWLARRAAFGSGRNEWPQAEFATPPGCFSQWPPLFPLPTMAESNTVALARENITLAKENRLLTEALDNVSKGPTATNGMITDLTRCLIQVWDRCQPQEGLARIAELRNKLDGQVSRDACKLLWMVQDMTETLFRARHSLGRLREEHEDVLLELDGLREDLQTHRIRRGEAATLQRVRQTLAEAIGGKCKHLVDQHDIPLITVVYAAIGKHRRSIKSLKSKLERAAAESRVSAETHTAKAKDFVEEIHRLRALCKETRSQAAREKSLAANEVNDLRQRLAALSHQVDEQAKAQSKVTTLENKVQKLERFRERTCMAHLRAVRERNMLRQQVSATEQVLPACSICFQSLSDEIELEVLKPCGHACVCADCVSSVTACPVCRGSFGSHQKVYFFNV